jgi:hypothetical protein
MFNRNISDQIKSEVWIKTLLEFNFQHMVFNIEQ